MVFYAAFNSISVMSRRQFTLFMSFLGFTSTRLGLKSVLPKDTPTKKADRLEAYKLWKSQVLKRILTAIKPFERNFYEYRCEDESMSSVYLLLACRKMNFKTK